MSLKVPLALGGIVVVWLHGEVGGCFRVARSQGAAHGLFCHPIVHTHSQHSSIDVDLRPGTMIPPVTNPTYIKLGLAE
jgi:hypothetical protein